MPFWTEEFWPAALLTMNEVLWVISQSGGGSTAISNERHVGPGSSITLNHTPISGTLKAYRGGARQDPGGSQPDYTLSGATVTPLSPLLTNEVMLFDYNY